MRIKQQLNMLAIDAKNGSQEALDRLTIYYVRYISKIAESKWYRMNNEAAFECRCVQRLKQALETFDPDKDDFDSVARFRVKQAFLLFIKRGKRKTPETVLSIEDIQEKSAENGTHYDPTDESEDCLLDSRIIKKEMISMLAQGDRRKKFILSCWAEGITNESEISRLLAQLDGRSPETHRKFLKRYRNTCKAILVSNS